MTRYSPRTHTWHTYIFCAAAVVCMLTSPAFHFEASAEEIPHENYDLVGSNLDVVIAMLNSSIVYSEYALDSMYQTRMLDVEQNLSVVRGILAPADDLLDQIQSVAQSYANLSVLLPPFVALSEQEDSFSSMEVELLAVRQNILTASQLANLTGDEMLGALRDVTLFNTLIAQMNATIDEMLLSARDIIALEVEGRQPFSHNDLIPLIERLRDLLRAIQLEVDRLVEEEVPWDQSTPFLIIWVDKAQYRVGEIITGGGYLFFNRTFARNYLVHIEMDGRNITSGKTNNQGKYTFQIPIPLNASWLGGHSLKAWAITTAGTLNSETEYIDIILIPTRIRLTTSTNLLSWEGSVVTTILLTDDRGNRIGDAPFNLSLDVSIQQFGTSSAGSWSQSWLGSQLGYGTHSFHASFAGGLPYGPSESGTAHVTVDIPTTVSLMLFSDRFRDDFDIVGNGTLLANSTTPLPDQEITISIDGSVVANLTTDSSGGFAFSIPANDLTLGGHSLKAAFLHRDTIWRYSEAVIGFSVFSYKHGGYPFLPSIPGWGGWSPDVIIPEIFFGQYAYMTWLLLLVIIAILIKVHQLRKSSKDKLAAISEAVVPLAVTSETVPTTIPSESFDLSDTDAPQDPNGRIVWYYQLLLGFLTKKHKVTLKSSMTHWEVARFLGLLGYPFAPVREATVLFERAYYSGTVLTNEDSVLMSSTLTRILKPDAGGAGQ